MVEGETMLDFLPGALVLPLREGRTLTDSAAEIEAEMKALLTQPRDGEFFNRLAGVSMTMSMLWWAASSMIADAVAEAHNFEDPAVLRRVVERLATAFGVETTEVPADGGNQ